MGTGKSGIKCSNYDNVEFLRGGGNELSRLANRH